MEGMPMGSADAVAAIWPVFGLVIRTPRLVLRLPRESDLPVLARVAREIAGPGEPRLQMPWMYEPSPAMERRLVQRYWRSLAHWKPESWHLAMAVYVDGEPVGVQDIWANDFVRARSVGTGFWITRSSQGKGLGTEARSAVLDLAFSCLGAGEALTEYLDGNIASERVSRKFGYVNNGERLTYREGSGQVIEYHLRLTREGWEQARNGQRAVITGFERCASMFGLDGGETLQLPATGVSLPGDSG
jgi:RimJ/RimL family protein N-acetyltransferase